MSAPKSRSISSRVEFGILDRVMQDRRDDRRVVELHVGENRGDFERMRKIRVARSALLRAMRLHGVDIGAIERHFVGLRIIVPHPIDKFILPHHDLIDPQLETQMGRAAVRGATRLAIGFFGRGQLKVTRRNEADAENLSRRLRRLSCMRSLRFGRPGKQL